LCCSACCDIAGGIASFYQVSPLAAALWAPTQIWVTIAAKLNYDIVKLNPDVEALQKKAAE
jgi:benzodiazapine receptor